MLPSTMRPTYDLQAIKRGIVGSPTYLLGDEPFFGQDRLDFVERALAAL